MEERSFLDTNDLIQLPRALRGRTIETAIFTDAPGADILTLVFEDGSNVEIRGCPGGALLVTHVTP